jgi:hypothetical protein
MKLFEGLGRALRPPQGLRFVPKFGMFSSNSTKKLWPGVRPLGPRHDSLSQSSVYVVGPMRPRLAVAVCIVEDFIGESEFLLVMYDEI